MLVDIQGTAEYFLYDPEIASTDQVDVEEVLQFCTGNLAAAAIKNFFVSTNAIIIVTF